MIGLNSAHLLRTESVVASFFVTGLLGVIVLYQLAGWLEDREMRRRGAEQVEAEREPPGRPWLNLAVALLLLASVIGILGRI